MYRIFIKPLFDFLAALLGLLLLSPIFILVTIGLYFANQGKPFFYQARPGKNEKIFKIIKFKSMNDKRDAFGKLLPDAERLTAIGTIVRKTSLDEIPQLINILKGEMSWIGPRPLLPKYLPYYTEGERLRHNVRPGITGWAQIHGRNKLDWDNRLKKDVDYVSNVSLKLDLIIFFKTIFKVFNSEGLIVDPKSSLEDLNEYRKKMNFAIFISGYGRGAINLMNAQLENKLNNKCTLLISELKDAGAVAEADKVKIKTIILNRTDFVDSKSYEKNLLSILIKEKIDFIFLTGYMQILRHDVLTIYKDKIINIHPSLLPSFKGVNVIQKAMKYGVVYSGITTHLIDKHIDKGTILHQTPIYIKGKNFKEIDEEFVKQGAIISIETINGFKV